jgi:hypothetical protein
MDEGVDGFIEVDSEQIRDKPYLNEYTITGLTLTGNFYIFKLAIFNEIGSVESLEASF